MSRIIALLNEKNHYLEKFYALNEKELQNYLRGNFDTIEQFYGTRERILDIIKYLDAQVGAAQLDENMIADVVSSAMERQQVREALNIRDEYVARIVEQDLQVLSCIETAKNDIIRELQELKKGKKAVNGYKSPTFAKRLDEEA